MYTVSVVKFKVPLSIIFLVPCLENMNHSHSCRHFTARKVGSYNMYNVHTKYKVVQKIIRRKREYLKYARPLIVLTIFFRFHAVKWIVKILLFTVFSAYTALRHVTKVLYVQNGHVLLWYIVTICGTRTPTIRRDSTRHTTL